MINKNNHPNFSMHIWEFISLIAALMAMNAFAIDIMLPAMGVIADHYKVVGNNQQWLIYSYILGFGVPQLFFGPITDKYGRRNLLKLCMAAYIFFAFLCMFTFSFYFLCLARLFQGVFASGIRVIAISIVRDLTVGRAMARIMSLVMTVFMIIPIIAPLIGQGVMIVAGWKWTFGILGIVGILVFIWVHYRLPETLENSTKGSIGFRHSTNVFFKVLQDPITTGYMISSGFIYAALFAFIASAEQIFNDVFDSGSLFSLWFAIIAGTLALANFINFRIVDKIGMRRISHVALILFVFLSFVNLLICCFIGEQLFIFLPLFALTFGCFGMLGANFSAIAMETQGDKAGTASALYGFFTTAVSSVFGFMVSSNFNGTVIPILIGFIILGISSLIAVIITENGKLFGLGNNY